MGSNNEKEMTAPFQKILDPTILLPLLEKRLPESCLMYNSVKMYPRFVEQGSFYALNGEIDEGSWFAVTHFREDDGQGYHIWADKEKSRISHAEAVQILTTCPLFNWDEPFSFSAVQIWISEIVQEVSVRRIGHFTVITPCQLFYKELDECLSLDIKSPDPSHIEIKPLDKDKGLKFLLSETGGSNVNCVVKNGNETVWSRFIEKNESAGVYVDGLPVCGIVTRSFGILGPLSTLENHKRKGYASLTMQYVFKELAKSGIIPATQVVPRNTPSIKLHEKLGCKRAGMVDFVEVWPSLINKT
ncbi:uncharacterized protein LOC118436594 [Folsomia candida]|uniref:uncharacterized protein LOC118436594 n=1 Tax=Folsomia candida TaxID=158441 RepID=UPI0016052948|nr:uncharacterized protein LOC118436594 [Folsomia candida]